MKRFLYYFPGVSGMNPEMLARWGLLRQFRTGPGGVSGTGLVAHGVTQVIEGMPDNGTGCVVAMGEEPLGTLDKERWRWVEVKAAEGLRYFVGLDHQMPPGPGDLARELGISGNLVTLADAQAWEVPLLRRWDRTRLEHITNLPTVLTPSVVGDQPQVKLEVAAAWQEVDALAQRTAAGFMMQESIELGSLLADGAAVLAVNYRIGTAEAGLLGLFDAATAVQVLRAAVDVASLEAQARELGSQGLGTIEPEEL